MICKKCGRAMIKVKQKENYYYYQCSNCKSIVGKKSDENEKTENPSKSDE